jgi:transposase
MSLADFIHLEGYKFLETHKHLDAGYVLVSVEPIQSEMRCKRCKSKLEGKHGQHRLKAKYLPLFAYDAFIVCWRRKGYCATCKKIRSEDVGFLSKESPHLTKAYESTIEELTEIAAVSRVAEFTGEDKSTVWRLDYKRLTRLRNNYKIPHVTQISVDEVYARKKKKDGETRNDRFFTIVTCMKTKKVVWVSDSRRKEGLDSFYKMIGPEACKKIAIVAQDQHQDYLKSTKEHCPNARVVYDKFHVLKSFNEALNEARKLMVKMFDLTKAEKKKLTGKFKFILSKRSDRRTEDEKRKLEDVAKDNKILLHLELIKESVFQIFRHDTEENARKQFELTGQWIMKAGFPSLKNWYCHLEPNWEMIAGYYGSPVTSALSEGVNNVIKTIKRRAYGYRNMDYFKLKIMQVCGFLNSNYLKAQGNHESMA